MDAIRAWWSDGKLATGLVAAGAVAIVFLILRPFERVVERRVEVVREVPVQPDKPADHTDDVATRVVSQPAEVEDLEVYDGSGMILTIPGEAEDDAPTTVIWLSSEDTIEGPI